MATWTITLDCTVIHVGNGKTFHCGKAESALLPEVEGWVACEAKPWDVVKSPSGVFVHQVPFDRNGFVSSS